MFFNNHFSVVADRWVPNGPGSQKNVGQSELGTIKQEWHEPSSNANRSGKNFVELEDGRVFMRYDIYLESSPYGWNVVPRDEVKFPEAAGPGSGSKYEDQDTLDQEIEMDEEHNIASEVAAATEYAGMARMPFSWIETRKRCNMSAHYQAHYVSLNN